ncbi:hypothetical protein, partial [Klebsiella aerogenes]
SALYILAFFLCPFIRVEQPGFARKASGVREGVEYS